MEVVELGGERYYRRAGLRFAYDVPATLDALQRGDEWRVERRPTELTIYSKVGFHHYYANHEEGAYFVGRLGHELSRLGAVPAQP